MSRNGALWLLTALLVLASVALFVLLPGVWGFLALGLALIFVPIPGWQALLGKSVRLNIRAAAIAVLTVLTVGITFVTLANAIRQPPSDTVPAGQTFVTTEAPTAPTTLPATVTTAPAAQPATGPATVPPTEQETLPPTAPATEPTPAVTTAPTTQPVTEPATQPTTAPAPVPSVEPSTQSAQPSETVTVETGQSEEPGEEHHYVLNTSSQKFHDPDCGSVKQMKDENREDYNGTREELLEDGYAPCGRCKP